MKSKSILLSVVLIINVLIAGAANFRFLPHTITQPDGAVINCFVSGDEYFNWLHDQEGYTIIQANDGFYYYGIISGDSVAPTGWLAGKTNPEQVGLAKWAKISQAKYDQRRAFYTENTDHSGKAPHTGILNNLVVYIRFNDDTEFTTTRQAYDNKFNTPTGNSLKSYYNEVSYSSLTISSTHYPECVMTTNYSYQDFHDRNYFEPYNATSNPGGYNGGTERTEREHTLLKDAITWINVNSPVPAGLNIDGDNDNRVDNVCFIIRGGNGAWAELLWAHRWSLFSYNVYVNGKRVYDYTFQPETQVDVKTLCHEMFHALGAPDLYHYTENGIDPVGPWDLMESGGGHMSAYMKWKYTNNSWIGSIPTITVSGTYTLQPLSSPENNCYKIASPNSSGQFFVVEYRKKEGTFEGTIPGSGLLVYRIDPSSSGNASGPPDEVYVYRPGGTTIVNGTTNNAYFSAGVHRTKINDQTSPSSFLQNGSPGGLDISKITEADTTISFTVNVININDPAKFSAISTSNSIIMLEWQKNPMNSNVVIAYDTIDQFGTPLNGVTYTPGGVIPGGGHVIYTGAATTFNHTGLLPNTQYFYKAWSVLSGSSYSPGMVRSAVTLCGSIATLPYTEGFEGSSDRPSCWFEDNTDPAWSFIAGNGLGAVYGYPATAHTGLRNACLVDVTTASDYNTLITPLLDLSGYSDVRLKFWMFMQKWGSRQDELMVYYRTNPGQPWVLLESYTTSISAWTEQTINLPAGSEEIQIGFRGNAKWALGVCIDDIEVTGTPLPTLSISPANQDVLMSPGSTSFVVTCPISWTASSDSPSWCTVTPSGTGDGPITANYTENTSYSKRMATITVTTDGIPSQTVTVTQNASNISVGEHFLEGIRIYPNPAKGFFRIEDEAGKNDIREVIIADYTGREVISRKVHGEKEFDFDLSSLAQGTYTIKLRAGQGMAIRKLVIIR
ncbi:MAG: M6 family metalloprotease domain-containing protein [Bacteroidales bacterium]|nr:M6 family metalloprotease domain-containing protein [Bacteroidales bacterium]